MLNFKGIAKLAYVRIALADALPTIITLPRQIAMQFLLLSYSCIHLAAGVVTLAASENLVLRSGLHRDAAQSFKPCEWPAPSC